MPAPSDGRGVGGGEEPIALPRGPPDASGARTTGTAADTPRSLPGVSPTAGISPAAAPRQLPEGEGRGLPHPDGRSPPPRGRGPAEDARLPPTHPGVPPRPSPIALPDPTESPFLGTVAGSRVPGGRAPPESLARYLAAHARAVGEGVAGRGRRRGWGRAGGLTCATAQSPSRGRKQGAPGGGGLRSLALRGGGNLTRGRLLRHPSPPPRGSGWGDGEQPPVRQKEEAGGGRGSLPGVRGPETSRRPGPPPGSPVSGRRASGRTERRPAREAPHLCPEWVAAHGPGSAVSGRRR